MPAIDNTRLTFAEQIAFFRSKLGNLIPTERWDDIWQSAHDRGFMVAGAQKADMLADFAGAIEDAITNGSTLEEFRARFDDIVERYGWDYRGGRDWRTRVIYRTNMNTSYAAGRLAQLRDPELLQLKPWWQYQHNDAVQQPRPQHVAWDGLTLSPNDPWWQTHYPPNGWGCQCYVVAVSQAEAEAAGATFTAPPDEFGPDGQPAGIDRGWAYQPGDTVADTVRQLRDKIDTLPTQLAQSLRDDIDRYS